MAHLNGFVAKHKVKHRFWHNKIEEYISDHI
jgi:hypothetical protein